MILELHIEQHFVRRHHTGEEIDVSGTGQCWDHASCPPQGTVRVVPKCVGVTSWIKSDI